MSDKYTPCKCGALKYLNNQCAYVHHGCVVESAALRSRIAGLEAWKADALKTHLSIVNGECAPDEKHCSCVPSLRKRIAELEAERRWVPVGERLPSERANRVIALTVPGCRIVAHYGSLGDWVDMSGAIRDVTHWMPLMPLPAPPEEEV